MNEELGKVYWDHHECFLCFVVIIGYSKEYVLTFSPERKDKFTWEPAWVVRDYYHTIERKLASGFY